MKLAVGSAGQKLKNTLILCKSAATPTVTNCQLTKESQVNKAFTNSQLSQKAHILSQCLKFVQVFSKLIVGINTHLLDYT
jgi:hypothetical protein